MDGTSEFKTKLGGTAVDIPIVHSFYQLYKLLHEQLKHFPKSERYTLGSTIQNEVLSALESILTAAAANETSIKLTHLRSASAKVDLLKLLIRLAADCKCLSNATYLEMESSLQDNGRMLGGWIKSLKN